MWNPVHTSQELGWELTGDCQLMVLSHGTIDFVDSHLWAVTPVDSGFGQSSPENNDDSGSQPVKPPKALKPSRPNQPRPSNKPGKKPKPNSKPGKKPKPPSAYRPTNNNKKPLAQQMIDVF